MLVRSEFMMAMPKYEKNTVETARLAVAAREYLFNWARDEGIDFDLKKQGILHIYRDKKGFEHAGYVSQLLAKGGLPRQAVTPEEMKSIEPTLAGKYYGGYYTQSDSTGDIHKFTTGLAKAAQRLGVSILYDQDVRTVKSTKGLIHISSFNPQTAQVAHTFDGVVICAGVESRNFAAQLGDRVNIYPVKGYSITVNLNDSNSQAGAPNVSILDDETKLVTSRLGIDRFRVAGTAEFNGYNRDIRADRITPILNWVHDCFPSINTSSVVPWAGLRPMMPDMMPKVGAGNASNVFYNTGHGHLGWTLSAITANIISDKVKQAMSSSTSVPGLQLQTSA